MVAAHVALNLYRLEAKFRSDMAEMAILVHSC